MNDKSNMKSGWQYHQLSFYLMETGISDTSIKKIQELFHVKTIQKDQYFATEGETSDRLGFVCSGCFVMYTSNVRGDLDVKEFVGKNNLILATWNTNISLVTLQALTDCMILEAKHSEVKKLYATDPDLEEIAKMGAEKRMNVLCEQMFLLKNKTAGDRYLIFKERYGEIEKDIPKYLIASFLGITPTQLSRIRKTLA